MDQLWGVLGRAGVDSGFFFAVTTKVVAKLGSGSLPEPEDVFANLNGLHSTLTTYGFRPSRFETAEINRIFFVWNYWRGKSPVEYLAEEWRRLNGTVTYTKPPEEMWKLLGLCCIDPNIARRYFADPANVNLISTKPPAFNLTPEEVIALTRFFSESGLEGLLLKIHQAAWIPPDSDSLANVLGKAAESLAAVATDFREAKLVSRTQCSAAFDKEVERFALSYRHLTPAWAEFLALAISFPVLLPPDLDFTKPSRSAE